MHNIDWLVFVSVSYSRAYFKVQREEENLFYFKCIFILKRRHLFKSTEYTFDQITM